MCEILQTRSEIDGFPGNGEFFVIVTADVACHYFAGGNSRVDPDHAGRFVTEICDSFMNVQGCPNGSLGVIVVCDRGPEYCHH